MFQCWPNLPQRMFSLLLPNSKNYKYAFLSDNATTATFTPEVDRPLTTDNLNSKLQCSNQVREQKYGF